MRIGHSCNVKIHLPEEEAHSQRHEPLSLAVAHSDGLDVALQHGVLHFAHIHDPILVGQTAWKQPLPDVFCQQAWVGC